MPEPPSYSTPATDALCAEIAKKSHGVCFLGFSRGKDSICTWLQLTKFFRRIIPFHVTPVPGLSYVDAALDYYEDMMNNTHILRLIDGGVYGNLMFNIYQTLQQSYELQIKYADYFKEYDNLDIIDRLRLEFHLPNAWCAFGITASDSIDRRIYVMNVAGKNKGNKSFYPCYDWEHDAILDTVEKSGLLLPSEYKYTKHSMTSYPCATYNKIWREHYPADYAKMLSIFPFMEAKTFREDLLDRAAAEERELRGLNPNEEPEDPNAETANGFDDNELGMGETAYKRGEEPEMEVAENADGDDE